LFGKHVVYNSDTAMLFFDARNFISEATLADLHGQMDYVKEYHTYINRINIMLECVKSRLGE